MTGALLAVVGAYGVYLVYTAVVLKWGGLGVGPRAQPRPTGRSSSRDWLVQAGLADVKVGEFALAMAVLFIVGFGAGLLLFGVLPAIVVGFFAASFPLRTFRKRRDDRLAKAQEAWPRMIEEIRIQTVSLGRSIPQALFDVGHRAPVELRPAFGAAHREWLVSTNFDRTLRVLKDRLADPTADAACETLLTAHERGGADVAQRLEALADDRRQDTQNRKDARARQAGVRFANPPPCEEPKCSIEPASRAKLQDRRSPALSGGSAAALPELEHSCRLGRQRLPGGQTTTLAGRRRWLAAQGLRFEGRSSDERGPEAWGEWRAVRIRAFHRIVERTDCSPRARSARGAPGQGQVWPRTSWTAQRLPSGSAKYTNPPPSRGDEALSR